jgi:hypothetical protein
MKATKRRDSPSSEVPGLVPENRDAGRVQAPSFDQDAMRYIWERIDHLEASSRFGKACKAIARLQRDPYQGFDYSFLLAYLACRGVSRQRMSRKTWQKVWTVGTGKTWKSLKDFPKRLRGLADEVERINSSSFFAPREYVNRKTVKATIVRGRLSELPGVLRLYATALEQHLCRVPDLIAQSFPPPPRGHSTSIFDLAEFVKGLTGRPHDKEVTELLNAAGEALGEKCDLDALDLAQARSRRKKADN